MSVTRVVFFGADPLETFMNNMEAAFPAYDMSGLTNGQVQNVPSINAAHPLAMELGAQEAAQDGNYTSPLPAVGVEMLDDQQDTPNLLGGGAGVGRLTQEKLDELVAMTLEERYENGVIASDAVLAELQSVLTAAGSTTVFIELQRQLFTFTINVSAWTESHRLTRMFYNILKAIISIEAKKRTFGKKPIIQGQQGLYSFDFGRDLFGAEFSIRGTSLLTMWKVDSSVTPITNIEESWPNNRLTAPGATEVAGGKFVTIGE